MKIEEVMDRLEALARKEHSNELVETEAKRTAWAKENRLNQQALLQAIRVLNGINNSGIVVL